MNVLRALAGALFMLMAAVPQRAGAATVEVDLSLDYQIVKEALEQQIFTGPQNTAELFADALRCNTLALSDPQVSGDAEGRLRLVTGMRAQVGTPLGGACRFARAWEGTIETEQTAEVEPGTSRVIFRVVDSRLLKAEDGSETLPRFMRNWIRDYVHPRLAGVVVDLGPAVSGIEELLDLATAGSPGPADHTVPAAASLATVSPLPSALVAKLSLEVPDAPPGWAPADEPPLTPQELAEWDARWQAWDAFATWMIKTVAVSADAQLNRALAEALLDARYDLRDALAEDDRDRDPVRALFLKTWGRLAPLLHGTELPVPGGQALHFAAFVSAGDALQAIDSLAPHIGLSIDQDTLRSLARMLAPGVSDADLTYGAAVDPQLRVLLGLDPDFEADTQPPGPGGSLIRSLTDWLLASAEAAQIDPALLNRLNTWVPRRPEIDTYLQTMALLLDAVADAERGRGKIPREFIAIYDPLLRATAWQESCWRQYFERNGSIEPIRSSSGSVGLMQINLNVWRGVYDAGQIQTSVGYNARAGNEILVHYLVDYAIRRNEHGITGDVQSLVRATYAAYNGGPGHLRRYREPKTSASLRKIDDAFWNKYLAIQQLGHAAVKPCLAGG